MPGCFLTELVYTTIIQPDVRIFLMPTSYTFNILTCYAMTNEMSL